MKTSSTPLKLRFLVTLLALFPILARAATLTWDANTALTGAQDGSGTWDTTSTNWWTGTANAAFNNATPDVPTFGAAGGIAGTVTLGANIEPGNITFNAPTVGTYTIAGGAFTLFLTNRTVTVNAANATISAPIAIGPLSIANATANAPSAVLTLTGPNTYTNFNLGANAANTTAAVRVGANNALGVPTGSINIGGGQGNQTSHRIEITGGVSISNNVTVAGRNNPSAAIVNLSSGNTIAGTWTRTTGGADLAIESALANGLTLSGQNGGGIALASQAGAPRFYVLRGAGGGTVSGVISNGSAANNLGMVKTGPGTWTFSGPNTYTNGTIVDAGTLNLDYSTQNNSKLADQGPLTLGGGTVNLSGGSHTEVVFSTTILGGNSSVTRSSGTSTLRLNAITRNRGGVVDFGAVSIADTDAPNVNGILGGYATISGTDWAMNSTGGADGPITAYTGYTDIAASGSTIADAATSNVRLNSAGGGGNIVLGSPTTTINTLLQNRDIASTIDTTGGTLRLGPTGGILLPTSSAGSLTIGTSADAGTLTAGGADNTSGEVILINNSTNVLTVNSTITDNGSGIASFTKAGSGAVTLNGNNSYTGSNIIAGGTLNISSDANLGTVPGAATPASISINGGVLNATASFTLSPNRGIALGPTSRYGNGTISVAAGQTLSYLGTIANADTTGNGPGGSLTKTGPGTLALTGVSTYTFGTIINGGTLSIIQSANVGAQPSCYIPDHLVINGGTLEAAFPLTLGNQRGIMLGSVGGPGTGTFQVDDSVTLQLDSRITDNWNGSGSLTKTGSGILIITSGLNDYSGDTTINAGTLQLNNSRALPNGAGKGNLIVNSSLAITNGANPAINGLSGSGTVDNVSSSLCTFGIGNNNQTSSFGGVIQNSGGGPLTLNKMGNGTLTLTGSANHTGSTLVSAGTLALSGAAAIGSTTNIAVSAGATFDVSGLSGGTLALNSGQAVSGNGAILGTINAGSGAIAPGASAGTLTIANVTLNGSLLNYDLANVTTTGNGVNDYLVVTGNLNVAGSTALNLNFLNGVPASSGKYTLISYGSFSGDVNNISVPSGFTITNNSVAKTIELLVNHIPANLVWRGDGAGDLWDVNTTPNWIQSGTNQFFFNGDTVAFDDTGSNSPPIFIAQSVISPTVTVNAAQNYDFQGSSISGTALIKAGGGMFTLENDNTFPAGTSLTGTLQIGNGGTVGTLTTGSITNNGLLAVNRAGDVILGSAISGSGSLSQIGTGTTALTASNSYAGATSISSGRVYARNAFAFGSTNTGTTVTAGAQIYIDLNVDIAAEPLFLNGSGLNLSGDGALRKGGAGITTFAGPITLGSDTTINIDGNATLNLSNTNGISGPANLSLTGGGGSVGTVAGPINLNGGAGVLTKTGSASWTLSGSNSMSLATVDNGTLILANNNALGTNLNVVLTSTTGGAGLTGTRLTLGAGVSIPANRSLTMPSSGAGTVRSAFVGTGANLTNTWAGTVTLFGDSSSANNLGFGVDANSTFIIGGNVTADSSFTGKLLMRGNATGTGIIAGTLALNASTGQIQTDDGSTWIFTSSANTWATNILAGSSTIKVGVNNALPIAASILIANGANNRLDLAGFNQQLPGLDIPAGGLSITNSSPVNDSTLTISASGTSSYGGTINDGIRRLNLIVASGNLTLTNPASLNLAKSAVSIAGGGAVLELDFVGTNRVQSLILNGVTQAPGVYNILNASPYIAGVGNLLVQPGPTGTGSLTNSVAAGTMNFSWPPVQGWRLQVMTNSSGVTGTNWVYLTDGSVSATNMPINPTNPAVFFRLRYP